MLVLSRFPGEHVSLVVPPSDEATTIDVMIVDILGSKCRLGFDAPMRVAITRDNCKKTVRGADDDPKTELEVW